MRFFERSFDNMVSKGLQQLTQNTNITQMVPGSKTRFLLDTIFDEQAEQHSVFNINLMQAFLRFADGEFLDYFGDMLNKPRKEATYAETTLEQQNFMFYTGSGTFGDINASSDFTIPAGTQVTNIPFEGDIATPGLEEQPIITYTLVSDVICAADRSFVYAEIRASVEGKDTNLPRNVLNRHNFVNYTQIQRGLLKCTNEHAISSGTERESGEAYRYRLLNQFKAKSQAVKIAVRLAALSVPGVANVYGVNFEQGPGTYSLYIQAVTPTTNQGLLNMVVDSVSEVTAEGVRPFILAPLPLGLEFVTAITWSPRTTNAQKSVAYAAIRDNIESALGLYDIGESVFIADLIRLVLSSDNHILGIGREISNSFEEIYLTRSSADGNGVTRSSFVGDTIEPLYNERIILETAGRHRGIEFI
ncbi:MAG: baseplate J/gp47 family protein [Halanaerobiales bacterium]|nr:baseplate J/gp47 family protein [Halanaerobiales bacterium]